MRLRCLSLLRIVLKYCLNNSLLVALISSAHSRITGVPQLLPSTSVVMPPSNPSQIFILADLPYGLTKIKMVSTQKLRIRFEMRSSCILAPC